MANKQVDTLRASRYPLLEQFAKGYVQQNLVANNFLPDVMVDDEIGKYPIYSGKQHLMVHESSRPLRAPVKELNMDAWTLGSFEVFEHALETVWDRRENRAAEKEFINLMKHATMILHESLLLEKEAEKVGLLMDSANYGSNTVDLSDDYWDETTIDPIERILYYMDVVEEGGAPRPNVIGLGPGIFRVVRNHPKVIARIPHALQKVDYGILSALISDTDTNQNQVAVFKGQGYTIKPTDGTVVKLWTDDSVVLAYNKYLGDKNKQFNKYDMSFGKTFVQSGYPMVKATMDRNEDLNFVAEYMAYKSYITAAESGYLIKDTVTG